MARRKTDRTGSAVGTISREIGQKRPFDSLARELVVTLLRTGDVMHHAVDRVLSPFDSTQEQYNVLRILRGADADGLPTLEIAQRMVSRSPNITRLVDKMIAKGLAERWRCPHDRRVVRIRATSRGIALLKELDGAMEELLSRVDALDEHVLKALVASLDAVRGHLAVPTAREGAARTKKV